MNIYYVALFRKSKSKEKCSHDNHDDTVAPARPIQWERSEYIEHQCHECNKKLLKESLKVENYKKKFHQLLCREEEVHVKQLEKRYNCKFVCFLYNNYIGVMANILFMFYQVIISLNMHTCAVLNVRN